MITFKFSSSSSTTSCRLPNGNIIVGASDYASNLKIINPNTLQLIKSFSQHGDGVDAIAVLPNGNIVVGGAMYYAKIRIINPETGELVNSFSQNGDGVDAIAVLPNGTIAAGGIMFTASVRVYDTETGEIIKKVAQRSNVSSSEEVIEVLNNHQESDKSVRFKI